MQKYVGILIIIITIIIATIIIIIMIGRQKEVREKGSRKRGIPRLTKLGPDRLSLYAIANSSPRPQPVIRAHTPLVASQDMT